MSEGEDDSSKTEEPSQKKLEDARKKGETVLSREISHWFMILAGMMFIMLIAGPLMRDLGQALLPFITRPHDLPVSTMGEIGAVLSIMLKATIIALLLPFLAFIIGAIAGPMLQVGPMWSPDSMMPKLERISLIAGIGRMFSKRNLVEFIKGLLKLTIVAIVVIWSAWPSTPTIEHSIDLSLVAMMLLVKEISMDILVSVLVVMFCIAAADYLAQRFMFMSRMRMSRSEMKEEYKQSEGDPIIKQRLRQLRMERARQRMMASVPTADVVITNPEHYAVALKYNPPEDAAPIVVAMGMDNIAQKIKEVAREHDIPVVENPPLARALYATADIDRQIPGEHYRAVAEIISYVFKLKNKIIKPQPKK